MASHEIEELCQALLAGQLPEDRFLQACLQQRVASTDGAQVDLGRRERCGFPEVIYGEGKSVNDLLDVVEALRRGQQSVLATRLNDDQQAALREKYLDKSDPNIVLNAVAKTFRWMAPQTRQATGSVAVVAAGTSDAPIAAEAVETLAWMNVPTDCLSDVGVAGPQRLVAQVDRLQGHAAVVVVAGMEGALPSVVGGYVACPVIAVPTSVGYGANLGGLAALLSMLNCCAANVTVVNVDAGFKAAYVAGLIATRTPQSTS